MSLDPHPCSGAGASAGEEAPSAAPVCRCRCWRLLLHYDLLKVLVNDPQRVWILHHFIDIFKVNKGRLKRTSVSRRSQCCCSDRRRPRKSSGVQGSPVSGYSAPIGSPLRACKKYLLICYHSLRTCYVTLIIICEYLSCITWFSARFNHMLKFRRGGQVTKEIFKKLHCAKVQERLRDCRLQGSHRICRSILLPFKTGGLAKRDRRRLLCRKAALSKREQDGR